MPEVTELQGKGKYYALTEHILEAGFRRADLTKEEVQAWIDHRFGVPNTFNIQLLTDFLKFLRGG